MNKGLGGVDALADIFINKESQNNQNFLASVMRGGVPKEKKVVPPYTPLLQLLHAANRDPSNRMDVRTPQYAQGLQQRASNENIDASPYGQDELNMLETYFGGIDHRYPEGAPWERQSEFRQAASPTPTPTPTPQPHNALQRVLGAINPHQQQASAATRDFGLPQNYNPMDKTTYPQKGLLGLFHKYAPPTENDTMKYVSDIGQMLGVDPSQVTRDFFATPRNFYNFSEAVAKKEGYYNKGTLAHRLNNPGNLRFAGQPGAVADPSGFARFPSKEAGFNALRKQLLLDISRFF